MTSEMKAQRSLVAFSAVRVVRIGGLDVEVQA